MQTVTDRWYVIYARVGFGLALLLLLAGLVSLFVPGAAVLKTWGFSPLTCVLAGITVLYVPILYKPLRNRMGAYNATLIVAMLQAVNTFVLMQGSGNLHSPFMILWFVLVLTAGLFGSYAIIGSAFLISFYFLLLATAVDDTVTHDPVSIAVLVSSWLVGVGSYFLWHSRYVDRQSQHVSQLNKLLKSKQLQSESLIEAIAEGVIAMDADGTIILMNPAAASMVEWSIEEALGINVKSVMTFTDDKGVQLVEQQNPFFNLGSLTDSATHTLTLTNKKGTSRLVSLVLSPVWQQGTQELAAVVAVFRDITAARAEEQRRADFISTASHEMRTPVAAIEGYLALALNDKVSKIDSKARDFLEKAHASAQHLGQLFQDLLTSAKAEDGRLVSHPEVIELGSYLEQLADNLKFGAQNKGLLTDFTIGASTSETPSQAGQRVIRPLYYILADPERLREVITNLFDNAVKYTDSGKVSVGLTGNDKVVQLFIRDTGHGIPKEDIPHLFQKFYRVDNSATRTIGGTGLGLFIARKIIELYSGRIWVDSEYGQGSTFYINLPRLSTANALDLQKQQADGQELTIPK